MPQGQTKADLVHNLKEAIRSEKITGSFYKYIAEHVENGYIKKTFNRFAQEEATKHKDLLQERLTGLTGETYEPDLTKMDVPLKENGFSLSSAAKAAKESEVSAIEFYKLARDQDDPEYKQMYDDIIKDEKQHSLYLQQDKLFEEEKQLFKDSLGVKLFALFTAGSA
ncbi:MAG: ferritin family protein [Candidatus Omnitrophica bacterium]|nr:ferritin family protein [Candidatus Omnitrophota bacterium]